MFSRMKQKLKEEVGESLDARTYIPASNLLPFDLQPIDESETSNNQILSIGNAITNPAPPTTGPLSPSVPTKLKDPVTETYPPITSHPEFPVSPHIPSKYAETYELEKFQENSMIIFNHEYFFDGPARPGTKEDEKSLRNTLTRFGFKGETHDNIEKRPLIDTVKNFALKTDFSRYGCICVAILTHGNDRPGYLEAYDRRYNEYEIFEHFDASKNPTLAAKPIIFIIQACRGALPSPKVTPGGKPAAPAHQLDLGEEREDYHLPMDADRIVFHSAYVGRASVRHKDHGSWFIQTLCSKMNDHASTYDLETIFRLVRKAVALDSAEWVDQSLDWKQMPVVTSTLIRKIHLVCEGQVQQSFLFEDMMDSLAVPTSSNHIQEIPKKPCSNVSDVTPSTSPMIMMQPQYMPCSCFLEYFEYLKKCLDSFVSHNSEDIVAKNLLKMVERAGKGAEYNRQKFDFIQSVWEHFETNMHKFPPEGATFVHRLYH